jgi:thioredoxin-like negative regulator of GroEL
MSTIAVAFFHVSLLATAGQSYAEAHRVHVETGRPLVILVGADWCPACVRMKQSVIPQARGQGVLSEVAFVQVDADREPELARKLMRGGLLPQLIVYHKSYPGWQRRELTGAQSVAAIQQLVTPPEMPSILIGRR